MMQLIEGGSRDHSAHFGERLVGPCAVRRRRQAQPPAAASLDNRASQRTVVDDFTANRVKTADPPQRLWTNQDAAARCSGRLSRRIQHEEEKYECRNRRF